MDVKSLFTEHPASVGETYGQHMVMASSFSLRMLVAACAGMVHAVFPFLFVKTGSTAITELYERMVTHRDRRMPGAPETQIQTQIRQAGAPLASTGELARE